MLLEKNGIPYFSSEGFARTGPIVHGFLGREAGLSPTRLSPPNMGYRGHRSGDCPKNHASNYEGLSRAFGLSARGPVTATQVHGNSVFIVEDRGAGGPQPVEADAIITDVPGVAVGVFTADCLPILLFDPVKRVAGAVHAGWKGTVKRVAIEAVEALTKRFGSSPGDIVAALGPSIGPCCYRVDDKVTREFKSAFGECAGYVGEGPGARLASLDIMSANVEQLISSGLGKDRISKENICTSCRNELFFSYRKEGALAGRQISFVMIKE
jgi:YfiH family protein